MSSTALHQPVLVTAIVDHLVTDQIRTVFDGTLGLAGHATAILQKYPQIKKYFACDLDKNNLRLAKKNLAPWSTKTTTWVMNFSQGISKLIEHKPPRPVAFLFDLGLCSTQLDSPQRGFAFRHDGPLHMSFDCDDDKSCVEIINQSKEADLRSIMREFGQEPHAKKLAQAFVQHRQHQSIATTATLRQIITENVPPHHQRKSLMRVFQAFRIATNQEITHLRQALDLVLQQMQEHDRLGVISYHSVEDGLVKNFLRKHSQPITRATPYSLHEVVVPPTLNLISKKPLTPSDSEVEQNPRSRSAKLRLAVKL